MTRQVMDGPEIGAFLETQDTGVLSLARDDDGYGIPVAFTVYDYTPEGWKSVVAEGDLETLTQTSLESSIEESIRGLEIPYFQVHAESSAALEHNVVRLNTTKLTGIAQGRHGQREPQ